MNKIPGRDMFQITVGVFSGRENPSGLIEGDEAGELLSEKPRRLVALVVAPGLV